MKYNKAHLIRNLLIYLSLVLPFMSSHVVAGERIWVPVRWCGVEGAPSMDNPAVVNEGSTDDVLWRRHERPTDRIYQDDVNMTFRAGATSAIKNGPQSFPIIRDPRNTVGNPGDLINGTEHSDAISMCRRVWTMGDPLYFEQSNNGVINTGVDTLLSRSLPTSGFVDLGHDGALLVAAPADVKFVDLNVDELFSEDERVYRDENNDGTVDNGDTLLTHTSETVVGGINGADLGLTLIGVPATVKYLDLIRKPAATFNIGYPAVQGVTSVNANDVEVTGIAFPVHGNAASGIGGLGVVMDDPSQYLPPGPDYTLFETQLVAHEFGHSFGLNHGDGIDDNMDGILDNADDPTAPVPGAGPGTLCDSNNVMSYCWLDNGTSGNPNLEFIGVGAETDGSFTALQTEVIRDFVLTNVADRIVDPVIPPLVSARVDAIAEIDEEMGYIDIADFSVRVESSRQNTFFSLATRRPLPESNPQTEFQFLLNLDGNSNTGGDVTSIDDQNISSDFKGVEYVALVRFRGREAESIKFYRYMPQLDKFENIRLNKITAEMIPLNMTPDFPMGRGNNTVGGGVQVIDEIAIQEIIQFKVPLEVFLMPSDNNFSVEYIAKDLSTETVDKARSTTMNFDLPVFPDCHTNPASAKPGSTVNVFASGLLPDREVHLLLGDTELGTGHSDAAGTVNLPLTVPNNARTGDRLVTVGALAVSADCNLIVERGDIDDGENNPNDYIDEFWKCCKKLSLQMWIIIALLFLIILFLLLRRK